MMNWSEYFPPLHPEGRKFVLGAGALALALFAFAPAPFGWSMLIVALFIGYFFRDPDRYVPNTKGILLSPADGRVLAVTEAPAPPELAMDGDKLIKISIFLSVLDVHVNRAPDDVEVERAVYVPGTFVNASFDKASEDNERQLMRLRTQSGHVIGLGLIAGLVARRIVCTLKEGARLERGERIAIIRFGSRADIYLDPAMTPMVAPGQRVLGGETVIATTDKDAVAPYAERR